MGFFDRFNLEAAPEAEKRVVGPDELALHGLNAGELAALAPLATTPKSRRDFLKMALLGTGVVTGIIPTSAEAAPEVKTDVLEIEMLLEGGADWHYFLNFLGVTTPEHTFGPLKTPPPTKIGAPPGYLYVPDAAGTGTVHFLNKWPQVLAILSDHGTNNHDMGRRSALTGDPGGLVPSVPVMRAAHFGKGSPFAYVKDNGVMAFTGGLPVGSNSLDVSRFLKLSAPNLINPNNPNSETILPPQVVQMLTDLRKKQIEQVASGNALPKVRKVAQGRLAAQGAGQDAAKFFDLVKTINQNQNDPRYTAALIAMKLFQAGYVAGVSLQQGGYDTHQDATGAASMQRYQQLIISLDRMFTAAKQQGVKLRVVLKSDFGRNGLGGGDPSAHWPIGATIFLGEGIKGPMQVGVADAEKKLVGEKTTIAEVEMFHRDMNGVGDVDFGVKTAIAGNRYAIKTMLDKKP